MALMFWWRLLDSCAEDHVEVGQRQRARGRLAAVDALDALDDLEERAMVSDLRTCESCGLRLVIRL